jgi:hypothetical protein
MTQRKIIIALFSLILISSVANFTFAADPIENNPAKNPNFQLVPCGVNGGLQGPTQSGAALGNESSRECGWSDLITLANNVVNFLVVISVSLAILAFCYAGFLYITAFGQSGKVEQAHHIFSAALTGIFFVLCGWLIIATILKVLVKTDNAHINDIVPFQNVQTIQNTQQ